MVRKQQLTVSILLDGGTTVTVAALEDLRDHCSPAAPAALIKCVLLAARVLELDSAASLEQQLRDSCDGGLDIQLWSDLPQGSGLGTSSILAGCCLAAVWTAAGQKYTRFIANMKVHKYLLKHKIFLRAQV